MILECVLPSGAFWGPLSGQRLLLAVIASCHTGRRDATETVVSYRAEPTERDQVVVDIRTIQSVVGRVRSRGKCGIIDRGYGIARTTFVEGEEEVERDEDEDLE